MHAAVVTLPEQATCTDYACLNAVSHESLCDCSTCFGAGHGAAHRATRQAARARHAARVARTGDVFLGAATADVDVPVQRREIPWCVGCMNATDDCECEA